MILGSFVVDTAQGAVHTHRDSYLIDTLTAVSVRRPFQPAGLLFGFGLVGTGVAFGDLLYPVEIVLLMGTAALALIMGREIGRLALLSRDLRGSELSGAVWGRHEALQHIRSEIVAAITAQRRPS